MAVFPHSPRLSRRSASVSRRPPTPKWRQTKTELRPRMLRPPALRLPPPECNLSFSREECSSLPLCAAARPVDRAHNAVAVEPSDRGLEGHRRRAAPTQHHLWFSLFTRWTPLLILWMICRQVHHDPEALEGRGARDLQSACETHQLAEIPLAQSPRGSCTKHPRVRLARVRGPHRRSLIKTSQRVRVVATVCSAR